MAKAQQVDKMLSALEAELVTLAKSAHAALTKAHPGEETPAEESPNDSVTDPGGSAGGPPPPSPSPDPSAGGDPSMGGGDMGGGQPPPTHEEMVQQLSQEPPEMLMQLKAALDEVLAQQGGGDAAGASPPPPSPSPSPAGPPMGKAEPMAKSEHFVRLEHQAVQLSELRKTVADLGAKLTRATGERQEAVQAIEAFLQRPAQRAATSAPIKVVAADEDLAGLAKTEVTSRLRAAMRREGVSKKDRAAVDGFLFDGAALDTVKHLIVGA